MSGRAYNLRARLRREDGRIPEKFFHEDPDPGIWSLYKKLDRRKFNKWPDDYYRIRGWDSKGVPSKETLEKSGLGFVRGELEERGG